MEQRAATAQYIYSSVLHIYTFVCSNIYYKHTRGNAKI